MIESATNENQECSTKRNLVISTARLEMIKAFSHKISKNIDALCVYPNAYSATLTAGNHSFTEVTRC